MNIRKITPGHLQAILGEIDLENEQQEELLIPDSAASELEKALNMSIKGLAPSKTRPSFIYQSAKELQESKRAINRDGIHFYNYYTLPTPCDYVSPVILDILCPFEKLPALNNGHFEEAITVNLGPDNIMGRWDEDINAPDSYSEIAANCLEDTWITGDSYFEPSYCRHSYSLAKGAKSARIVSYTAFNEVSRFKSRLHEARTDQIRLEREARSFSHWFYIIERFRKSSFISVPTLCQEACITLDDYERVKSESLDGALLQRIAKVLRIDQRLLENPPTAGDTLGKEYLSLERSREKAKIYESYLVAPTACSPRTPDLKGSFIYVDCLRGGAISNYQNTHYLVTGGELEAHLFVDNKEEPLIQRLQVNDSLWISPGLLHSFGGKGSLLALTNGEYCGYLDEIAISNLWNSGEVIRRLMDDEKGWGYDI